MPDMMKETKDKMQALIAKWTPLRAHGVKLSLSYPSKGSTLLRIKHNKPITGTTKDFIEGLLMGSGLGPWYYPDGGPCDCYTPLIEWVGPEK
jgi:hypothetical protein